MADRNEGCCRAAVHSEGFAHDHADWLAEVESLRTQLAEVTRERDEARAAAKAGFDEALKLAEALNEALGRLKTYQIGFRRLERRLIAAIDAHHIQDAL